ncbi:MAG: serine/threonine-protein kinase [Gemmataceae bacterium]|nr:serine/threonine-protein kinase [Gemmataceae bacterium]
MTRDVDLQRWGEPPATVEEETLAQFLDTVLDRLERGAPVQPPPLTGSTELLEPSQELLQTATWVFECATSILERSTRPVPLRIADCGMRIERPFFNPHSAIYNPQSGEAGPLPDPFPGEFCVRALLGAGSFGKVWLADDLNLARPVAFKALHLLGSVVPGSLESLRREAQLLAGLRHPNIVQVYTWRQSGDEHYLILEFIAGGSFADRLEKEGALGWQQAARYIADVAEALRAVHGRGVVHRDIKPANILWDPERDEALLTDFGLSIRLGGAAAIAGTPLYMAPEAFEGRVTPAGDVYSLAATLFALATGEVPFPASDLDDLLSKVLRGLPDPDARCVGMPEALERVIRAGLAPAPEARPPLAEFAATLRSVLNRLLSDSLLLPALQKVGPAPVDLRLTVSRLERSGSYVPLAASHPELPSRTRDMKKVPPAPERVSLRTGDRVRIQVAADREGHVTVFNVGPTGNLNLLWPEQSSGSAVLAAHRPVDIADVELTPPAGPERLVAVWSRAPLSLAELHSLAGQKDREVSRPYLATRDMKRVQESVQRLRPEDWYAVVLELDHAN